MLVFVLGKREIVISLERGSTFTNVISGVQYGVDMWSGVP